MFIGNIGFCHKTLFFGLRKDAKHNGQQEWRYYIPYEQTNKMYYLLTIKYHLNLSN